MVKRLGLTSIKPVFFFFWTLLSLPFLGGPFKFSCCFFLCKWQWVSAPIDATWSFLKRSHSSWSTGDKDAWWALLTPFGCYPSKPILWYGHVQIASKVIIRYPHMFLVYHTHTTHICKYYFQRPERKSIHLRKILRHPLCSCCMANMNADAAAIRTSWLSCPEVLGRNKLSQYFPNIEYLDTLWWI